MNRNNKGQFNKGVESTYLIKPVIGQQFGELVVVSNTFYFNSDNRPVWTLQCQCGTIQNIKAKDLRRTKNPRTTCSSCARSRAGIERMKNVNNWKQSGKHSGIGDMTRTHYHSILVSTKAARRKKKDTSMFTGELPPIEYLWELYVKQNKCCALTGLPIEFGPLYIAEDGQSRIDRKKQTASLDRIDSSKGYIAGNLQWVHKVINKMKSDSLQTDFIYFCSLVTTYDNTERSL